MQIELVIDGKKRIFTAPFVPMMAKRKYLEIMARLEEKGYKDLTNKEILEEDDEFYSILSDIVFKNQFTIEEMYNGASEEYLKQKLTEAIFGKKAKEGNVGKAE